MTGLSIPSMMEAGAHFGHQTRRWNPKMKPYLYGARSGVHIIDLQKTFTLAGAALKFIKDTVAQGGDILVVGTKPQAREVIAEQSARANMFYVTERWMGGTLTNFKTIRKSIDRLIEIETKRASDGFEGYTKKELLDLDRQVVKLTASLGGIKTMTKSPSVVFVIDPKQEHIAVAEANKLGLPVVAMVDSNCDPDPIDHLIPSNDDAISSIAYFVSLVADACLEGLAIREDNIKKGIVKLDKKPGKTSAKPTKGKRTSRPAPNKTYVARGAKDSTYEGDASAGYSAKTGEATDAAEVEAAQTAAEAKTAKEA